MPVTFAFLAKLKGSEREHRLQPQEVYFFSTWEEEITGFRALGQPEHSHFQTNYIRKKCILNKQKTNKRACVVLLRTL